MKHVFLRLLFMADAATSTAPVLSSDKLTELKTAKKSAWAALRAIEDDESKEYKDAKLALYKIESEIKAEETQLQKAANDAAIAEKRNERLGLNTKMLELHAKLIALRNDKKAAPADVAAAETEFNTAKEVVDNELLAKYAASSSAKKAVDGSSGQPSDDGKSSESKAAILELARAGKTKKEIEAEGYARSTVWHTINNAKKAGETFPNH
jgi:hypothetical protein